MPPIKFGRSSAPVGSDNRNRKPPVLFQKIFQACQELLVIWEAAASVTANELGGCVELRRYDPREGIRHPDHVLSIVGPRLAAKRLCGEVEHARTGVFLVVDHP